MMFWKSHLLGIFFYELKILRWLFRWLLDAHFEMTKTNTHFTIFFFNAQWNIYLQHNVFKKTSLFVWFCPCDIFQRSSFVFTVIIISLHQIFSIIFILYFVFHPNIFWFYFCFKSFDLQSLEYLQICDDNSLISHETLIFFL